MYKKCSNCGRCCAEEVCEIGRWLFGDDNNPCRALVRADNNKWLCGVVLSSGKIHKGLHLFFVYILGIGKGCDNEEFVGIVGKLESNRQYEVKGGK